MRTRTIALLLAPPALVIAGCDGSRNKATDAVPTAATATPEMDRAALQNDVAPAPSPLPSENAGASSSAAGDAATRGTPAAAAAVVQDYYAAIDSGDFRAAYDAWGNAGQASHQTFAAFKRGFAQTATVSVETGAPTNGEGAAGSVYIDVPVTVAAQLKDGTKQRFTGSYTLRRVNDVPGATDEQLHWHIASAALKKG